MDGDPRTGLLERERELGAIARRCAAAAAGSGVTEKTIEHHLSSVHRKLDIRSRVRLVRALPGSEPVAA